MIAMRILIILFPLLASATMASAASTTLAVSAVIPLNIGSCSFQSTPAVNFGTLDPLSPQSVVTATSNVVIRCTGLRKTGATVGLSLASPTPLTLKKTTAPAYSIPYMVNTLPTSAFVPPNGAGTVTVPVTAVIYGRDYGVAPAGSYADTMTIEVTP